MVFDFEVRNTNPQYINRQSIESICKNAELVSINKNES